MRPTLTLNLYAPVVPPLERQFPYKVGEVQFVPTGTNAVHHVDIRVTHLGNGYGVSFDGEEMAEEAIDTFPEAVMRAWLGYTQTVIPPMMQRYLKHYAQGVGYERAFASREDAEG